MTISDRLLSADATGFDPSAWFMLVPMGTFPISRQEKGGAFKTYQQVVDQRSATEIVASFNRKQAANPDFKLLIDFEHFSHDQQKSTEAAGWIEELETRPTGVWFRAAWSTKGTSAIRNREYRFISPVWFPAQTEDLGGNSFRPIEVSDAGLTNRPNLGEALQPFWNRAGVVSDPSRPCEPSDLGGTIGHIDAIIASRSGAGVFVNRVAVTMAASEGLDECDAIAAVFSNDPALYEAYRDGLGGEGDNAFQNRESDVVLTNDVEALAQARGNITPILNRLCTGLRLPIGPDHATSLEAVFHRRPDLWFHYCRALGR